MRNIPAYVKIIAVIAALLLITAMTVMIIISNRDDPAVSPETHGEIVYDGAVYKPASYRINVLFMGIDASGKAVPSGSYMNSGLSDFLCLLSFDIKTKECVAIHINRDTVTNVEMYGIGGAYLGKAPMQIALSHQYGDGMESSCLNTAKAVSRLLKDITIDYYVSLNMDAIPILNDLLGGVEVTVDDDFSSVDPDLEIGKTVTLTGKQAEEFVRGRKNIADQTNLSRMNRQRTYMRALYDKMIGSDLQFTDIYKELGDYIVTNCTTGVIEQFSNQMNKYVLRDIVSIPGEAVIVNGLIEYHIDEEGLTKLVIDNLYTKDRSL
ncbi:MAG: LCP family protein [Clostridia bacterium]|nr:LCP family protein [Clostridia bacterium]